MTWFETLDELIGREIVSFVTIGNSTLGPKKRRHASVLIRGTTRFVQGYGDTSLEALGQALSEIDEVGCQAPPGPVRQNGEDDQLADILG